MDHRLHKRPCHRMLEGRSASTNQAVQFRAKCLALSAVRVEHEEEATGAQSEGHKRFGGADREGEWNLSVNKRLNLSRKTPAHDLGIGRFAEMARVFESTVSSVQNDRSTRGLGALRAGFDDLRGRHAAGGV